MNITTKLAADMSALGALTNEDKAALKLLILDFFAASYAGYRGNRRFNEAIEQTVLSQGGQEEATVFLCDKKLPAGKAAFINSVYAHGAELDDGNKKAMGHIGVHVIPAVFSLAESIGVTDEDVLVALAVGYETYIRVSSAAQPGMVNRGFHSTGMAGTLASAAACAKLLKLDTNGIEDAIALATTMTGGLLSYGDSRPAIKPLNPAKAAENGVFAALLAKQGVNGPAEALEGPNGWFHAVADSIDESMLRGATDGHLLLHDCYIKLYPSCRHTHCGIEAGINLHGKCDYHEIEKVEVFIYPNAIKLAGKIQFPKDQDETKFSIAYTLACGLVNGSYGIDDMDPPRLTPEIVELISKIQLIPDDQMENRKKGIRGTNVRVTLTNGELLVETVLVPKGDPEKPLKKLDVFDKLVACASGWHSSETLRKLEKVIDNMGGGDRFIYPMRRFNMSGR